MPKYVVFNTIYSDGIGDFSHFSDIMKKLRADPRYNDVDFLAIVKFCDSGTEANYVRIGNQLKDLNIPFLYGKNEEHERYSSDEAVQKLVGEADQAIIISHEFGLASDYEPYLKLGIPRKTILEHETRGFGWSLDPYGDKPFYRDLGLQHDKSGIKIDDVPLITPDEAWKIMMEHDPLFSTQLLTNTKSPDFETLHAQHIFVPAYFNQRDDFNSFVHFLGTNHSVSQDKDIIMSVSGKGCRLDTELLLPLLEASSIKQIEVFTPDGKSPRVVAANPDGTKTIKIMQGFYLTDPSYNALFQLARGGIAGVSGDNSFERCVSMDVLPFYWSTNWRHKMPTLYALKDISQRPELPISNEARESYKIYFDPQKYYDEHASHTRDDSDYSDKPDPYLNLNVQEMITNWPVITNYLRKEKNFYNQLDSIMLEGLPPEALPALFKQQNTAQLTRDARQVMVNNRLESEVESAEQKNQGPS